MSPPERRWWRALPLLQAAASALAIGALLRGSRAADLPAISALHVDLLAAALLTKVFSLCVHELRLTLALPRPRPPAALVFAAGFTAGMINLALPARAGDAALVGLLAKLPGQRWEGALAAVARVGAVEVVAFALACLLAIATAVAEDLPWLQLADPRAAAGSLGLGLIGAAVVAGLLLQLGRRWSAPRGAERVAGSVRARIGQALGTAAAPRGLLTDLALAAVEIGTMIAAFALGLSAAGLEVQAPLATATAVLALSATASLVLPPGYGAGPTAAAAAVLGACGIGAEATLRYALCWWLISQVPAVLAGTLSLLWTRQVRPDRGEAPATAGPPPGAGTENAAAPDGP